MKVINFVFCFFSKCRYVFPAELYMDHLLFYSKYGHTYSLDNNINKNPIDHLNQLTEPINPVDKKETNEKEPLIKLSDIRKKNDKNNKSVEKKQKSEQNESDDDKTNDENKEFDEASTNLFKTWKATNNRNLYNFGSCTPIYEIANNQMHPHSRTRWPIFG